MTKIVVVYREKYKAISRILDDRPEILVLAHLAREKLSQGGKRGRNGDFTSETLLGPNHDRGLGGPLRLDRSERAGGHV